MRKASGTATGEKGAASCSTAYATIMQNQTVHANETSGGSSPAPGVLITELLFLFARSTKASSYVSL